MENYNLRNPEERTSLSSVAQELGDSIKSVLRSEIHLVKAEMKENGQHLVQHLKRIAIFGVIAAFGVLPLMAFLVIGLGRILNDNFWLSSLIVALILFAVGGGVAYAAYRRIKEYDLKLDDTRESVVRQFRTVDRKLHEVSDTARRRTAS